MMRLHVLAIALALAAAAAGCGEQNRTTDRSAANPSVPPTTPSAPPVSSSSSSTGAATSSATTPETHAGTPKPDAPPAPTAQDTTATKPQSDLSKSEEAHSMPKSGQVNNYNSPAYEPKEGAGGNK